ncbi:lysylphosphatidylglycerol synthase domain-containing protein [Marinicella sediminis]|uniref:Lysylphosphatidylglycerol synthase domain-containing protein n=1 Tax=Marinicella sediminis TaxID=1792834 RepID=A0ABV7JDB7_9GAMM|nr:lysylphosphatidylglycerol synthase domain-containing protein [Marinicella sediminis]
MSERLKKTSLLVIKSAVVVLSVYYIGLVVAQNLTAIHNTTVPDWYLLSGVLGGSVMLYVMAMIALMNGWLYLSQPEDKKTMAMIYFKSQLLKYTPGNVMHFVYRHLHSKNTGISHQRLIKATISETVILISLALLLTTPLLLWGYQHELLLGLPVTLIVLIILVLVATFQIHQFISLKVSTWLHVNLVYCLYFMLMGMVCFLIAQSLNFSHQPLITVSALYAAAWVAGYVVPGAPGGLGVREAAFVLLSNGIYTPHEALILIALIRLIAVAGEAICYLSAKQLANWVVHHRP